MLQNSGGKLKTFASIVMVLGAIICCIATLVYISQLSNSNSYNGASLPLGSLFVLLALGGLGLLNVWL